MLRLPRIPSNQALVDDKGYATIVYQQWWQQVVQQVESSVNGIEEALAAAGIAIAAAATAQAAAETATTAAASAGAIADDAAAAAAANAKEAALVNSYIDPASVLSATPTTITVASHERFYADGTSVMVTGGSLTSTGPGDVDYVSYDDPARTGGAVSYVVSTDSPTQSGNTHVVGAVMIPTTGSSTGGNGPRKPGFVEP